jgi:hypothetical protein
LICLTVSLTQDTIQARRVTTQEYLVFDRQTGVEKSGEGPTCQIHSVAPLPADVLSVILAIDRKYRMEQDSTQSKLTDAEIKALMYAGPHYASNPLQSY